MYIYLIYFILLLYEYYILYNVKNTQLCNKCFNNKIIDKITSLFKLLFIFICLKIFIDIIFKNNQYNLNIIQLIIIYLLNLSIVLLNILLLYYINIIIIQKELIEKEYNITCDCLFSINILKIFNNISIFINLFILINLIIYNISLIYNDIKILKFYNNLLNSNIQIKETKFTKDNKSINESNIIKINLPKENNNKIQQIHPPRAQQAITSNIQPPRAQQAITSNIQPPRAQQGVASNIQPPRAQQSVEDERWINMAERLG